LWWDVLPHYGTLFSLAISSVDVAGRSPTSLLTAMIDGIDGDCNGSNYGCGLGRLDLVCYCYYGGGGSQ